MECPSVPETVDAQDYSCPVEMDEFEIPEEMFLNVPKKRVVPHTLKNWRK